MEPSTNTRARLSLSPAKSWACLAARQSDIPRRPGTFFHGGRALAPGAPARKRGTFVWLEKTRRAFRDDGPGGLGARDLCALPWRVPVGGMRIDGGRRRRGRPIRDARFPDAVQTGAPTNATDFTVGPAIGGRGQNGSCGVDTTFDNGRAGAGHRRRGEILSLQGRSLVLLRQIETKS